MDRPQPIADQNASVQQRYPFLKAVYAYFDHFVKEHDEQQGPACPSVAQFFRYAKFDEKGIWDERFVSGNVKRLRPLFDAHPPLYTLLHHMTRIRLPKTPRTWPSMPTIAEAERTLMVLATRS